MAMEPSVKRGLQAALKKMGEELAKKPEEELALFDVVPITNGYLVTYNDVEEYDIKVPVYEPHDPSVPRGRGLGSVPKMETQKRWKLVRATVYCADAGDVKDQVDEALALEKKVKELIAQGILSGDGIHGVGDYTETDLSVGA